MIEWLSAGAVAVLEDKVNSSSLLMKTLFLLALTTCSQMVCAKTNCYRSLSSRTTQSSCSSPHVVTAQVTINNLDKVPETTAPFYSRRLADILEQLTYAFTKGWLNRQQFDDFKNWHASIAMEELILRQKNGGSIQASDAQRLERHLNGLDYAATAAIEEGSKVASTGCGAM